MVALWLKFKNLKNGHFYLAKNTYIFTKSYLDKEIKKFKHLKTKEKKWQRKKLLKQLQ